MPSLYDLKPAAQRLLRPIVVRLADWGISANMVTVAAIFFSLWFGFVLVWWPTRWLLILLPFVVVVRLALNVMDGMLAREHGQQSRIGEVLNELGDVVSDAALYLPLAILLGAAPMLVLWVVVLGIIIEMTGVMAMAYGGARSHSGPFGKTDRAVAFSILAFLVGIGVPPGAWLEIVLLFLLLLALATIVLRVRKVPTAAACGPAEPETAPPPGPSRDDGPPPDDGSPRDDGPPRDEAPPPAGPGAGI